jgi:hypothetical protein
LLASIAPLIDDEATKELAEKINEATKLAERDECRARGEPHLKLVDQ